MQTEINKKGEDPIWRLGPFSPRAGPSSAELVCQSAHYSLPMPVFAVPTDRWGHLVSSSFSLLTNPGTHPSLYSATEAADPTLATVVSGRVVSPEPGYKNPVAVTFSLHATVDQLGVLSHSPELRGQPRTSVLAACMGLVCGLLPDPGGCPWRVAGCRRACTCPRQVKTSAAGSVVHRRRQIRPRAATVETLVGRPSRLRSVVLVHHKNPRVHVCGLVWRESWSGGRQLHADAYQSTPCCGDRSVVAATR
jgi:hypothetical protein